MPALSAVAKPFLPESDHRMLLLAKKFIYLETLQIEMMQSKNSAFLLTQLRPAFNLLFEEQKLSLSTADMCNPSVSTETITSSLHSNPIKSDMSISSSAPTKISEKKLTPRRLKKQERGAKWKLSKLSTDPIKPQPQTILANSDIVSEISSSPNQISNHSSTSNNNSANVCKSNKNILNSSDHTLLSSTDSTINAKSVSNVTTVKNQSVSNDTPVPLHLQEGQYTGDLSVKGIRHGRGKMIYTIESQLGDIYEGTWKFDKFYGNGKYTFSDGTTYEGKYVNGVGHGRGTFTYSDGTVYSGELQNDDFNGIGTLTDATDGSVYSGEFKDDLYHGRGKLIKKDGSVLEGIFEKNKFVNAI